METFRGMALLAWLLISPWAIALPVSPLPQSYVSDEAGLLAADTRAELDRLASALDQAGRGEVAFLIVRSTGGQDPRRYGTAVFNQWGVGDATRNDGTLFLLAMDDRAAEIVLGLGIDNADFVALANNIMQGEMVPRFRQGSYDQGLVAGANAWLRDAYRLDLTRPSEAPVGEPAAAAADAAASQLGGGGAAPTTAPSSGRATPSDSLNDGDTGALVVGLSILAGLVTGIGFVLYKVFSALWWLIGSRFFPRKCGRCGSTMVLLDEAQDDHHLTPQQLTEERLRSIDHRVFHCPDCGHADKLTRVAWFSRYSPCAACGAKAVRSVSRTITSATTSSTGLAEVTSTCEHCRDVRVTTSVIPRISRSSSRRSSSFGGGSSRGGGASGRW
jgi:uncharacterized protein